MPVNVNIRIPRNFLLVRLVGLIIGVDPPGVLASLRPWLNLEIKPEWNSGFGDKLSLTTSAFARCRLYWVVKLVSLLGLAAEGWVIWRENENMKIMQWWLNGYKQCHGGVHKHKQAGKNTIAKWEITFNQRKTRIKKDDSKTNLFLPSHIFQFNHLFSKSNVAYWRQFFERSHEPTKQIDRPKS